MTPEQIRTIYVDRLNFLVDRELAERLVDLLGNRDFVGGDLLPLRREFRELSDGYVGQTVSGTGKVTSVAKPCTRQQRYVSLWQEVPK